MVNYQYVFNEASMNNYYPLNQLINYTFTLDDYHQVYECFNNCTSTDIKFIILSFLNSKLAGKIAQQFAKTITKLNINYELNVPLTQALGKFIFRSNQLGEVQIDIDNQNVILSALSYKQNIDLSFSSLCFPLDNIFKVQVLKIIISQVMLTREQLNELIPEIINFLPQTNSILDEIFRKKMNIVFLMKLALALPTYQRFKQLQNMFDYQFLISKPEKVAKLFEVLKNDVICQFTQDLDTENIIDFYQFFGQIFHIFNQIKLTWFQQIAAQFLLQTDQVLYLSEQSQFFFQGLFKYILNQEILDLMIQRIDQYPLEIQIQVFCNLFSYDLINQNALNCCLQILTGNFPIETTNFACYQLCQMSQSKNQIDANIILNAFVIYQRILRQNFTQIFTLNVFEYYDFTQTTISGALNQLSKVLLGCKQCDFQQAIQTEILQNIYFTPHVALFNFISFQSNILDILSLDLQNQLLIYIVLLTIQAQNDTENQYQKPEICDLEEYQIGYILSFLASFEFNPELQEFVLFLLNKQVKNQFISDLLIESVYELIPNLVYNKNGDVLVQNICILVDFCKRQIVSDDLLRVIMELYNLKDDEISVLEQIKILFNNEVLQYMTEILGSEEPVVRVCFSLLAGFMNFGVDVAGILKGLVLGFLENKNQDSRRNQYEISCVLSYLKNEDILLVLGTALEEHKGAIVGQIADMLECILTMTYDKFDRQTEIKLLLEKVKGIVLL